MTGQDKVLKIARTNKELREKLRRAEERELRLMTKMVEMEDMLREQNILINLSSLRLRKLGVNIYA